MVPNVFEKESIKEFDKATAALANYTVIHTVVPNAMVGLEFTESTSYDVIISKYDLPQINAIEMIRVLRKAGDNTPLILVVDKDQDMSVLEKEDVKPLIFTVLHEPYFPGTLCQAIQSAVTLTRRVPPQAHYIPDRAYSATSSSSSAASVPSAAAAPSFLQGLSLQNMPANIEELEHFIAMLQKQLLRSQAQAQAQGQGICSAEEWMAYERLGMGNSSMSMAEGNWSNVFDVHTVTPVEKKASRKRAPKEVSRKRVLGH